MRYMVELNFVNVVGKGWYGQSMAYTYDLGKHELECIGDFTRENVEQWLGTHAGDFQSILDFEATAGDAWIEFSTDEGSMAYADCFPSYE